MLAIAPGWELDVERGPDWLLVRIKQSEAGISGTPPLEPVLWNLLQQHLTYRLVLELDEIELLGSFLIGQLVALYRRIRQHDGVMRLCGLSAYNRQVLRTCRLDERFMPYHDRREAVMASGSPQRPR